MIARTLRDVREDKRDLFRIALAMIGNGLLRRNTEGGVRSEELGVVSREQSWEKGAHAEARRTRSGRELRIEGRE